MQEAAVRKGCVFFLDAGDGRPFETDALEGEDLMGWLIPQERAAAFEPVWRSDDVPDEWSDVYCWVIWENPEAPSVVFE